jgi:tetratricopeptide (TPR) repeat protein
MRGDRIKPHANELAAVSRDNSWPLRDSLSHRRGRNGGSFPCTRHATGSRGLVNDDLSGLGAPSEGKFSEAITVLQRAKQIDANQYVLGALGESYALSGNRTEALAVLAQLKEMSKQRYVSPHCIAMIYAGLGDKDQAFEWLNKALEARSEHLTWLKVDARMNPLRSDPRFAEMMIRVGLTP